MISDAVSTLAGLLLGYKVANVQGWQGTWRVADGPELGQLRRELQEAKHVARAGARRAAAAEEELRQKEFQVATLEGEASRLEGEVAQLRAALDQHLEELGRLQQLNADLAERLVEVALQPPPPPLPADAAAGAAGAAHGSPVTQARRSLQLPALDDDARRLASTYVQDAGPLQAPGSPASPTSAGGSTHSSYATPVGAMRALGAQWAEPEEEKEQGLLDHVLAQVAQSDEEEETATLAPAACGPAADAEAAPGAVEGEETGPVSPLSAESSVAAVGAPSEESFVAGWLQATSAESSAAALAEMEGAGPGAETEGGGAEEGAEGANTSEAAAAPSPTEGAGAAPALPPGHSGGGPPCSPLTSAALGHGTPWAPSTRPELALAKPAQHWRVALGRSPSRATSGSGSPRDTAGPSVG
eukprot:scaffold2.g7005.t1